MLPFADEHGESASGIDRLPSVWRGTWGGRRSGRWLDGDPIRLGGVASEMPEVWWRLTISLPAP